MTRQNRDSKYYERQFSVTTNHEKHEKHEKQQVNQKWILNIILKINM